MAEEVKDYSRLYEEKPAIRQQLSKFMDGKIQPLRHKEVDLREVAKKLENLPVDKVAHDALSRHYFANIVHRNEFIVLIKYPPSPEEVYKVKVNQNTLKAIIDKLPKRGNYRYFFRTHNCFEEVELEDSTVPVYNEKGGFQQIHLHLFERM